MSKVSADPQLNVPSLPKPYKRVPDREGRRLANTPSGTYDASKLVAQSIVNRQKLVESRKIVTLGIPQEARMAIKKRANSAKASRARESKANIRTTRKAKK